MKTTLRIICSPLPPRINTVLVLALLCCIAGMTLIAQQTPQPQDKPKNSNLSVVTSSTAVTWTAPTYNALKIHDWLEMKQTDQPEKPLELWSIDFRPENSVLIVKNEPVVAKQADGTWKITFKP